MLLLQLSVGGVDTVTYSNTEGAALRCSKKNLKASRPSEHPPVRGKNFKTLFFILRYVTATHHVILPFFPFCFASLEM